MVYRYIPILRFKAGEREALENLSPAGWSDTIPLLLLAPEQFVGKKATKAAAAIPGPAYFTQQMNYAVGSRPFFLDATSLAPTGGIHPLSAIAGSARSVGLNLIPATTLNATTAYQTAVTHAVATDGRGVALRIDLSELSDSANWVSSWPHPLDQTDLVVDLGATIGAAHTLGTAINPAFINLAGGAHWRSVTVAGSNMPGNFQGVAAGLLPLPRVEVTLWRRLSGIALPYRLDFGDYGTVALAPAPQGIAWGYPITVKYTLGGEYLICRGVRTKGAGAVDLDVQLRGHANSIVSYGTRGRLAHCWADGVIDGIATGATSPGGLAQWVGYSINRHIENTRAVIP